MQNTKIIKTKTNKTNNNNNNKILRQLDWQNSFSF